jgi:hypothetical protein
MKSSVWLKHGEKLKRISKRLLRRQLGRFETESQLDWWWLVPDEEEGNVIDVFQGFIFKSYKIGGAVPSVKKYRMKNICLCF